MLWVTLVVMLALAVAWRWLRQRSEDLSFSEHLPLLGCALAFRADPVGLLCRLAAAEKNVVLNMAGLRLKLLVRPEDVAALYRSRTLSSEAALSLLGFDHSLGPLNVRIGGALHSRILRGGSSYDADTLQRRLREALVAALDRAGSGGEVELYGLCREAVVAAVAEAFAGPDVAAAPGFCREYLDFQRSHEEAIAKAMVLGKVLAWPWLERARRKRLQLAAWMEGRLTARHSQMLGEEHSARERSELTLGLLSAATKNMAIGSASCVVYMLQHDFARDGDVAAAVAETLRLTCLSFGALRRVVAAHDEGLGPRGQLLTVSHLAKGRDETLFAQPNTWDASQRRDVSFCFGAGQHACPGKSLALQSMATVASLVYPRIASLGRVSKLCFDRPSLADRDYAYCTVK